MEFVFFPPEFRRTKNMQIGFEEYLLGQKLILGQRVLKKLLKSSTPIGMSRILKGFTAANDIAQRFASLGFSIEFQEIYWDWSGNRLLYQIIPLGFVTPIELCFG